MVVGGYVRVSSRRQRDETDSPASQRQRLEAAGATVFFEDLAVSGFNLAQRRKAVDFRRLEEAIRRRQITRLVTTRLDRIARRDALVLELSELCDAHGVEFVTLGSGRVDTTTASGWLQVKMQLLIAEHFSRQLSENVRHGTAAQFARGVPARSAGSLPFHLQRQPGTRHGVIEGPAWDDARRVVDELLRGRWSTAQAGRYLYERHGVMAHSDSVRTWLKAPAIAGHCVSSDGSKQVRDCWPALVTEEEYQQLQLMMQSKRRAAISRGERSPRALSGLCRCGECGGTMAYHVAKRGERAYAYIRCTRPTCVRRNVPAAPIERQLHGLLGPHIGRLLERLAEQEELVIPPAEVTVWRRELQVREGIPVEFRQPADQARIAELQGLIAEGMRGGMRPDGAAMTALRRRVLDVVGWFERSEEDRNTDLRGMVKEVVVAAEAKQIAVVHWNDGSETQICSDCKAHPNPS